MLESQSKSLEAAPILTLVDRPRLDIVPLPEDIAKKYAYDHRHEPYEQVSFILGISPRALQHKYVDWKFSPKTPCAGYVTARQFARFYDIPYPTLADRLIHEKLEGRKHGLIWEIPLSSEERKKVFQNERDNEKKRRKKDKRRKKVRKTGRTIWPDQAKSIILNSFPAETLSQVKNRLEVIGEKRTERAIYRMFKKLTQEDKREENVPAKHRRRFTGDEEWEVIIEAGKIPTVELAARLARKPRSIHYLYEKLGINFADHDKRISVAELARLAGYPASTLYHQISKGRLPNLDVAKIGRHIRVVWNGTEDELRTNWEGKKKTFR